MGGQLERIYRRPKYLATCVFASKLLGKPLPLEGVLGLVVLNAI